MTDMKKRRKGALVARPCDLCGALVDERDLIMSEVQGLRGMLVCSAHTWEREARVKPSFQDRGGVGQVPDLSIDPIWPGSNGGWINVAASPIEEADVIVYKSADLTRDTTTLSDDPDLQLGITSAGAYRVVAGLHLDSTLGSTDFKAAFTYSGALSDELGCGIVLDGASVDYEQLTSLGQTFETSLSTAGAYVIVDFYIVATTVGTVALQWACNSGPIPGQNPTLLRGSTLTLTTLA